MAALEGFFEKDIILGDCDFSIDLTPEFGAPELQRTF
jgi:hypothetical protein